MSFNGKLNLAVFGLVSFLFVILQTALANSRSIPPTIYVGTISPFGKIGLLLVAVFVALAGFSHRVSAADASACYGETLEVQLYVHAPDQENEGQVVLSLPNPDLWSMVGRDGAGSLHDAGCLEEPVPVYKVYGSGMLSKFQRALDNPPKELRDVRSLSMVGGLKQAVSEGLYDGFHKDSDYYSIPHGFRRRHTEGVELEETFSGRTFVAGSFYFPDHYLTPMGYPLKARCGSFGFCRVDYRLHERLGIRYEFRSSLEYYDKWIPQDQAIRALIASYMTSQPVRD